MEERPFDVDPLTGAVETFYFDHADDTFTIERKFDMEPLLEHNKLLANAVEGDWKRDLHRVASIPLELYWKLKEDGTLSDMSRLRRWLNDADNRLFRTKLGWL